MKIQHNFRSKKIIIISISIAILIVALTLILYFVLKTADKKSPRGAVVSNGRECAEIGGQILEKGGSAADAAIAALFCEGVAMPAACGLGGGFLMTIYTKEHGIDFLNARESAPLAATKDMFNDTETAQKGPLSIAVPGELKGYWELHKKYGKLDWKELVQPTIDLCDNGILVTSYLNTLMEDNEELLRKNTYLSEEFINPTTNSTYKLGEKVRRPRLAKTLRIIAKKGGDVIYTGELAKPLVDDIGGIITEEDLNTYQPQWLPAISTKLHTGENLYTTPLPGSGVILTFMLNLLDGYLEDSDSVTTWQRVVESFKFGYGKRTHIGDDPSIAPILEKIASKEHALEIRKKMFDNQTSQDPEYYEAKTVQNNDHGTAHISVLAPNGDAISVTSTINRYFGSGIMSESTGIILNDEMDDFSSPNITNSFGLPPSEANFIEPGRRPVSSMCPTIILDKNNNVRLITGGAGGSKITSSVALVIIKHLWFGMDLKKAMDDHRFHHQLFPMELEMEFAYETETTLVDALRKIGHNITFTKPTGFSAITSISNIDGVIEASSDTRRQGSVYFLY